MIKQLSSTVTPMMIGYIVGDSIGKNGLHLFCGIIAIFGYLGYVWAMNTELKKLKNAP